MRYLLLFMLLSSPLVWAADIIWMKNGDRLTGTIEEITEQSVRISLPYSQPVTLQRTAIQHWQLAQSAIPAKTANQGIKIANPQSKEQTWLWTGSGDFNLKLGNNSKKTSNILLKGNTELASSVWRYSLDGDYTYETTNNQTNNHQYKLRPSLDYFVNPQWFVRSSISAEYDLASQDDYLSLIYGAGPGYRFWNDKQRRLELIIQGGIRQEHFRSGSAWVEGLGKEQLDYPFAELGWDYRQPIPLWQKQLELFSKGRYERYLSQPSTIIVMTQGSNGELGIRYYFNNHLRLSWSTALEWIDFQLAGVDFGKAEWRHQLALGSSF